MPTTRHRVSTNYGVAASIWASIVGLKDRPTAFERHHRNTCRLAFMPTKRHRVSTNYGVAASIWASIVGLKDRPTAFERHHRNTCRLAFMPTRRHRVGTDYGACGLYLGFDRRPKGSTYSLPKAPAQYPVGWHSCQQSGTRLVQSTARAAAISVSIVGLKDRSTAFERHQRNTCRLAFMPTRRYPVSKDYGACGRNFGFDRRPKGPTYRLPKAPTNTL